AEPRRSGAMEAEVRAVPLTLLQTLRDCWMTCSISLRLPLGVWFWVRMVFGFVPSMVLQRKAMAAALVSWCDGTGQAEPPETLPGWRTSGTISLKEYPWAVMTDQRMRKSVMAREANWRSEVCIAFSFVAEFIPFRATFRGGRAARKHRWRDS